MVLRDAQPSDFAAVRRLLGQLGYAPDEAEFRHRFDSVRAAAGHRIIVAEEAGAVAGVLHVFERPALDKAMTDTIRTVCKVGGKVEFAALGSLPNDGKVIDDVRKYT